MPGPGGETNEVERLKGLLFGKESLRLTKAEDRIDGLESWVGDPGRLEAATAQVLVEALRRAEVERHRELAAAVAPVVVAAIRSEIHNSRDMMVEALYPITGRLVAAAVANAFKDLIANINQRLDAALSADSWRLRFKSMLTGRPVAELALAEARGAKVMRLLLLERHSGRLLAHWGVDGPADANPDLVSGMIAAITEFASSVLTDRGGELRTLDMGASQIYLRASQRVILAGEIVGAPTRDDTRRLDEAFLALVERHDRGAVIGADELAQVANAGLPAQAARRASRLPAVLLAALALLALGYGLYAPILHAWHGRSIDRAFRQARAADANLVEYPLRWRADWTAQRVTIDGLAGSGAAVARLVEAVQPAAAPLKVESHARIVATAETAEAALSSLAAAQTRLDALGAKLEAAAAARQTDEAAAEARIAALDARVDALAAEASASRASLEAGVASASARLDAAAAQIGALAKSSETRARETDAAIAANAAASADALARLAAANDGLRALSQRTETSLAASAEATTRLETLRGELAALAARITDLSAAAATVAEARARLDALQRGLAEVQAQLGSPERQLAAAAQSSALFFGERDEFSDAAEATRTLDALAAALRQTGLGLRVVGYADEAGYVAGNLDVSRLRAERVARELEQRGVPAGRLVAVGRAAQTPIVDSAATNHIRNRRVVFEPLLPGEAAP